MCVHMSCPSAFYSLVQISSPIIGEAGAASEAGAGARAEAGAEAEAPLTGPPS